MRPMVRCSRPRSRDRMPPVIAIGAGSDRRPQNRSVSVTYFSDPELLFERGWMPPRRRAVWKDPRACGGGSNAIIAVTSSLPRLSPGRHHPADGRLSSTIRHPPGPSDATSGRPRSIRTNFLRSAGWPDQPTTPGAVAWSRAPRACRLRIAVCANAQAASAAWAGHPQWQARPVAPPRQPPGPPCNRQPRQGWGR